MAATTATATTCCYLTTYSSRCNPAMQRDILMLPLLHCRPLLLLPMCLRCCWL